MTYDKVVLDSDDIGISGVDFFVRKRPDSDCHCDIRLLLLSVFDLFHFCL